MAESKQLQELTPCCGDTSEAHTQPWTSSVSPTMGGEELRSGICDPRQGHGSSSRICKRRFELAIGDYDLHLGTVTEHLSKVLRRPHPTGDRFLEQQQPFGGRRYSRR